ncbi:MAG: hypothetical protein BEN19_01820 [Epulopiscium sp. Nuni2H_MBin003]|nr:MAG: hypothetical protein BEN19_01820 [Epulopiscium sp. Nuni2H_MBin003]
MEILVGPLGSGKTYACYDKIKQNLDNQVIMIVPEQFNLEVQKDLANFLGTGMLHAQVLSFNNLVQQVMKNRLNQTPIIDDLERIIILKKVVEDHKNELEFFKKAYDKDGFIEKINTTLTKYEQFGIQEVDFNGIENAVVKSKIKDVKKIQTWFNEYIEQKFLTAERSLNVLKDMLNINQQYKNAIIIVDGFYTFTAMQQQVLVELYKMAKEMMITLPMDNYSIFYNSTKTLEAIERKIKPFGEIKITKQPLKQIVKSEDIVYLSQNYFNTYKIKSAKNSESVKLYKYKNMRVEVENVAKQIKHLVRDKNYYYSDIAIVTGDINLYRSTITDLFKEYEIPYFLDQKRLVHTCSLVSLILNLLDVLSSRWTHNIIMSLLKCYILPVDDIDYLENYIITYGISTKKRWQEEWQVGTDKFDLQRLNVARNQVVTLINNIETKINTYKKNGKVLVKDLCRIMYEFLEDIHIYDILERRDAEYKNTNQLETYKVVMQTLERLVDVLGNDYVNLKIYKKILNISFRHKKMGIIPIAQDIVLIGEIERTRLPQQKAIFIIGANQGVFPKNSQPNTIFSNVDLSWFANATHLNDAFINMQLYSSELEIYIALTKASDKLTVSYIVTDDKGKSKRPSIMFNRVNRLFNISEITPVNFTENIYTPEQTLKEIVSLVKTPSDDLSYKDAYSWYIKNNYNNSNILKHFQFNPHQNYLKSEVAKSIYNYRLSATSLEKFRKCACSYFIEYGLKVNERKVFKLDNLDIGNIFHSILQIYPEKLKQIERTWIDVSEEQKHNLVKECVTQSLSINNNKKIDDGHIRYMAHRIENMSLRAINAITYQLKNSDFTPSDYEYNFETTFGDIVISGKIDRIDIFRKEDDTHIKILDYKLSDKTQFNLVEVYYALQLQLLLYMDAYLRENPDAKQAGLYYFAIKAAEIKCDDLKNKEQLNLYKPFKLSGITIDNKEIINAIEKGINNQIIPVQIKKSDGKYSKNSIVASGAQLDAMRKHVYTAIKKLSEQMLAGKITAMPYKLGNKTACDYCKYIGICGFDKEVDRYDELENISKETVLEKMEIQEE